MPTLRAVIPVLLTASLALASCVKSLEIKGAERTEVEAFVTKEYGYRAPLEFRQIWRAHGGETGSTLDCGTFTSPPEFEGDPKYLRFIYDPANKSGQIEMHRFWRTSSPVSQSIMNENRRLFDQIWADHCKSYEPLG